MGKGISSNRPAGQAPLRGPVIKTRNLTKRYGDTLAVDGLDLTVDLGEVFGVLGPNGSGKTTTILMLLGLTEPTQGTVRVLDLDPMRQPLGVKARVGYLPDQIGFYYGEITLALLHPAVRALGLVFPVQLEGAILGTPLPLSQSLLLIWPHLTGLIAATILLFALGYVLFQRQEIRA